MKEWNMNGTQILLYLFMYENKWDVIFGKNEASLIALIF